MSTLEMNEVKTPTEYTYSVFNETNWHYNVNKAFFLIFLGLLYSTIRLFQKDFDVTGIEIFARIVTGPL